VRKTWIIKFPGQAGYINNKATVTVVIMRLKTVSASYEHYTDCATSHILANFRKLHTPGFQLT
jgi:hypothetical protein